MGPAGPPVGGSSAVLRAPDLTPLNKNEKGQAGLQWEGVPQSKEAASEKALSRVPIRHVCEGGGTKRKASPDDLSIRT